LLFQKPQELLSQLSIKNYALIDALTVSFSSGFTTITGETGAGKSILLGGLSLVLGKRADLSSLKDKTSKCTIEAQFEVSGYALEAFFEEYNLDYEPASILRREILPSGKSRAFINDTPVTLDILSALGAQLVDVHSQHQTLALTGQEFQFRMLDAIGQNKRSLVAYHKALSDLKSLQKELEVLENNAATATKELDYNSFLLQELEKAPLEEGILESLEEEQEQLSNVEQLLELLGQGNQLLNDEQLGMLNSLAQLQQATQQLGNFGKQYQALNERVQSVAIELADIATDLGDLGEHIEVNPQRLLEVNVQLQLLQNLFKKHQVATITALLVVKGELAVKVDSSLNIDKAIAEKKAALSKQEKLADSIAVTIRENRLKVIPGLTKQLEEQLSVLGMEAASFEIAITAANDFKSNGKDDLTFLFSANKGGTYGALKKVASGGELSRIMLSIKAILAGYEKLPTLMFDEIDTGVSGEISNRMGAIMQKMGEHMQVFSITHLPQVAARGEEQFKVFKESNDASTSTAMRKLSAAERVSELAEMLGGKSLSESALRHAKELLANQ